MHWYEIIGYGGSVFIATSLWMTNIRKLRLFNMTGASLFALYGLAIQAYPVLILNVFNVCVNIYFLRQIQKKRDYFTLLPLPEVKTAYVGKFLDYYHKDIKKYFPDFLWETLHHPHSFFVLRNMVPVGLFIYEEKTDGVIDIKLDYVIPDYQDFKNASFIFSDRREELKRNGFTTFETRTGVKRHQEYLLRIGFVRDEGDEELFRKGI